ncbi:hypothetical protein QBC40DRAFT_47848 [Triangularia verruculosa]|uniref:Uncharacterized protein n=1 Tax=Triangularia verruculosa TaxID=2587418 RepID=A0AAN6XK24_9PEZI|nr:hypothetical protein QBC40DRAFT_47848 [Triangularia verruculosa]
MAWQGRSQSCSSPSLIRTKLDLLLNMSDQRGMFLTIPSSRDGNRQHKSSPVVHGTMISTIPSRCISPERLNDLLTKKFPCGNYDVDVTQNVYQIRAPSLLNEFEIFNKQRRR